MNDKFEAGRYVAARLFPAENTIDEALVASASLQIALVKARQKAQQPCGMIQAALSDAVAASAALVEARRAIVGSHTKIVRLRDDLGLPATGFGCESPCLPEAETKDGPRLKVA